MNHFLHKMKKEKSKVSFRKNEKLKKGREWKYEMIEKHLRNGNEEMKTDVN